MSKIDFDKKKLLFRQKTNVELPPSRTLPLEGGGQGGGEQNTPKLTVGVINSILKNGGVIAFVTDTVWGIGCLPDNIKAVNKIYEIKNRDKSKPLILMSNEVRNLLPYVKNVSNTAKKLMDKYFPGALTVICEKSEQTPFFITSNKDTVGIRVPDNEFFKSLCSVIDGHVLATTSANLSNEPSSKSYDETKKSVGNLVDMVFADFGFKCNGLDSTVVLAVNDDVKVLRQGSIKISLTIL